MKVSAKLVRPPKYTFKTVLEGETIQFGVAAWRGGDAVQASYTVQAKCGWDGIDVATGKPSPSPGQFVCVTHGAAFASQLQKDEHLLSRVGAGKSRRHRLAWWCWQHKAFEVP